MAKKVIKKKSKKTDGVSDKSCVCSVGTKTKCGCIYGLGILGSAIYFVSTATSFWNGALGILKAMVWPAFMAYEVFKFIGA